MRSGSTRALSHDIIPLAGSLRRLPFFRALRDHYLAVFPLDLKAQRFAEGADWGVDGAVSVFCGDVEGFSEGDECDLWGAWRWVVFAGGFDGGDVFIDFGEEI